MQVYHFLTILFFFNKAFRQKSYDQLQITIIMQVVLSHCALFRLLMKNDMDDDARGCCDDGCILPWDGIWRCPIVGLPSD